MISGVRGLNRLSSLLLLFSLVGCSPERESAAPAGPGDGWAGEEAGAFDAPEIPAGAPRVVFLGDSISAGLHLEADLAFPAELQRRMVERGLPFELVNAGVSGDTTSGGRARLDWILRQNPQVVVVELGGNDGLRGIELELIEDNLRGIVEGARAAGAVPLLLGMQMPPSYGDAYAQGFRALYGELAEELGVPFVEQFLDGVGGVRKLNLPDGIHPNAAGHRGLADNVEGALAEVLEGLE